MQEVGKGMKLSVAYNKMVKYGYMPKSRQINKDIKRALFEKKVGMVDEDCYQKSSAFSFLLLAILVAIISYGVGAEWHLHGVTI